MVPMDWRRYRFFSLLAAFFLLIAVGLFRYGEMEAVDVPSISNYLFDREQENNDRSDKQNAPIFVRLLPSHNGILGNSSGKRHSETPVQGLVLSVRTISNTGVTRGAFLLSGDVRPYYGEVRPHIMLCRLLN